MTWLKNIMAKMLVNKYVVGAIAKVFEKSKGYKTQVGIAMLVLLYGAKFACGAGFIPVLVEWTPIIDQLIEIVKGMIVVAAGDKARRIWEVAKKTGDEVIK
jgi:hypothetical protein